MAKTTKKAAKKKAAPKTTKKAATAKKAGAKKKRAPRGSYSDALKKKVVSAIRKGMTHLEASKAFEVGVHSIPNWLKRH